MPAFSASDIASNVAVRSTRANGMLNVRRHEAGVLLVLRMAVGREVDAEHALRRRELTQPRDQRRVDAAAQSEDEPARVGVHRLVAQPTSNPLSFRHRGSRLARAFNASDYGWPQQMRTRATWPVVRRCTRRGPATPGTTRSPMPARRGVAIRRTTITTVAPARASADTSAPGGTRRNQAENRRQTDQPVHEIQSADTRRPPDGRT